MDFGALPPEVNSGRMYSGPGCGQTGRGDMAEPPPRCHPGGPGSEPGKPGNEMLLASMAVRGIGGAAPEGPPATTIRVTPRPPDRRQLGLITRWL
jgi:hypothetical protein